MEAESFRWRVTVFPARRIEHKKARRNPRRASLQAFESSNQSLPISISPDFFYTKFQRPCKPKNAPNA